MCLQLAEIFAAFSGNGDLKALVEGCVDHFGNSLSFRRQKPDEKYSAVSRNVSPDGVVTFMVDLCFDENAAAATAHEFLHLRTYMQGFPVTRRDLSKCPVTYYYSCELDNLLGHFIFLNDFIEMGFAAEQLFHRGDCVHDPTSTVCVIEEVLANPEESWHGRGQWNQQILTQWFAQQMGFRHYVDEAVKYGRSMFPASIDEDMRWMEEWFKRGQFRTPTGYAESVNELFRATGLREATFGKVVKVGDEFRIIDVP